MGLGGRYARGRAQAFLAVWAGSLAACVGDEAAPSSTIDAGCGIVTCPGTEACCSEIFPLMSEGQAAGFARRDDLLATFNQDGDGVRADFSFDAADQRGQVLFNLGRNVSISRVRVVAEVSAPGVTAASVSFADAATRGCAFGYALASSAAGASEAQHSYDIPLTGDQFCYAGGVAGWGSVLQFGLVSTAAGAGTIGISSIELVPGD